MTPQTILKELQTKALQTNDFTALQAFFQTREYKALSYIDRNEGFITAHKLMDFERCAWCYRQKYIEKMPDPTEEEKDCFLIGQAIDDLLTEGPDIYASRYSTVPRKTAKLKKENSGKILLSPSQEGLIRQLHHEFQQQPNFVQNPKKTIMFYQVAEGMIFKIETDNFSPENSLIVDVKTCADIAKAKPDDYVFQMAFYSFVIYNLMNIKCEAECQIVDKHKNVSRSMAYRFLVPTLESYYGEILTAAEKLMKATKIDLFPQKKARNMDEQKVLWNCPYYGVDGHGRVTEPLYY